MAACEIDINYFTRNMSNKVQLYMYLNNFPYHTKLHELAMNDIINSYENIVNMNFSITNEMCKGYDVGSS